ncbi:MAG TPA: hypothetical protein PLI95_22550, partial [Polyangiaceae bacterium]|nr:hypothetical protein [Polyangiaceae bacterium]
DSRSSLLESFEDVRERAAEADALRERVRLLEARIFALGDDPVSVRQPELPPPSSTGRSIGRGPATLAAASGVRSAVLADGAGLLIAGAGEESLQEGLAAFSGLVLELTERASLMVPIARVTSVRLVDDNEIVLACGLMSVGDQPFALAAVGSNPLSDEALEHAVLAAADSLNVQMIAP